VRAHGLQVRDQLREELRPIVQRDAEQIDAQVDRGVLEDREDFAHARCARRVAERHHVALGGVVALRVDDAHLIVLADQALDQAGGQGGLAAARGAGDEDVVPVRRQLHRGSVAASAEQDEMALDAPLHALEVVGDQLPDQLPHAGAVVRRHAQRRRARDRGHGVGHGDRALAARQERVVVFAVADADHLVARQAELAQGALHAGRLVDAGRQHQHGGAVREHLHLQAELPDGILYRGALRRGRRQHHSPDLERRDVPRLEQPHQLGSRRRPEPRAFPAGGAVQDPAVLGDDEIEQRRAGTEGEQVVETPPRHQDGAPPRGAQARERVGDLGRNTGVGRDGAVEACGERKITHRAVSCGPRLPAHLAIPARATGHGDEHLRPIGPPGPRMPAGHGARAAP